VDSKGSSVYLGGTLNTISKEQFAKGQEITNFDLFLCTRPTYHCWRNSGFLPFLISDNGFRCDFLADISEVS
jgi:hypothetical protein